MRLVIHVSYVLIRLTFAQRLCAGGVSFARPPFKRAGSPQSASMSGLILRLSTETSTKTSLVDENGNYQSVLVISVEVL